MAIAQQKNVINYSVVREGIMLLVVGLIAGLLLSPHNPVVFKINPQPPADPPRSSGAWLAGTGRL